MSLSVLVVSNWEENEGIEVWPTVRHTHTSSHTPHTTYMHTLMHPTTPPHTPCQSLLRRQHLMTAGVAGVPLRALRVPSGHVNGQSDAERVQLGLGKLRHLRSPQQPPPGLPPRLQRTRQRPPPCPSPNTTTSSSTCRPTSRVAPRPAAPLGEAGDPPGARLGEGRGRERRAKPTTATPASAATPAAAATWWGSPRHASPPWTCTPARSPSRMCPKPIAWTLSSTRAQERDKLGGGGGGGGGGGHCWVAGGQEIGSVMTSLEWRSFGMREK